MKLAASLALAMLARQEVPRCVLSAYDTTSITFGPEYIVPKPFDPRVLLWVASAVAQAAMETGMARKPLKITEYRQSLNVRVPRDIRDSVGPDCTDCDTCCRNVEPAIA